MAARCPAGPEPMTMMSKFCISRFTGETACATKTSQSVCSGGAGGFACRADLLAAVKPVFNLLPVHNAPPCGHIIRPAVLIFQVVRVLPHVKPHHRILAFHQRAVLVGR